MQGMQGMQGMPHGNVPYYPGNPYMYQQGMGGSNGGTVAGAGMQVPTTSNGFNYGSGSGNSQGMLALEESYIENILRLNRGKEATVYMTFENNEEWNAKVFKGIIEAAGRDHIILSDPKTGKRYILLMVYLDYITFDEEINYDYPFNGGMTSYSPR